MIGKKIYDLAKTLFPINRSLTGDGVRETLKILQSIVPELSINEVPSGTTAFDWTVPREWRVNSAFIVGPDGKKFCDFSKNNLHLVGYSIPVNIQMDLEELQNYLHSIPDQPDAVPYITSYYKEQWGFCISHRERINLKCGSYHVVINSELFDGHMTFGELMLPGKVKKEVFLSTYICHPSMVNNELSGPLVSIFLANWLKGIDRYYTYRIIFIPETIGSIFYLSRNLTLMKKNVIAGFNLSCLGDDRGYSYLPSRSGDTLSDRVAKHVLKHICPTFKSFTWLDRGSDEKQYCSPGVDLPIASMMRTKYGEYPEYHTSLDYFDNVVTPAGLTGGFLIYQKAIELLEKNCYPKIKTLCEPQLGRRGLYPSLSTKTSHLGVASMMNLISLSDGVNSLLDIAEKCNTPAWELYPILDILIDEDLIELV